MMFGMLWGLASALCAPAMAEPVDVGVVFDGDYQQNGSVLEIVSREIVRLSAGEFEIRFPAEGVRHGAGTLDGATEAVRGLLDDAEIEVVIALGPIAGQAASAVRDASKPVFAAVVIDAALQGMPRQGVGSGVPNLNYLSFPVAVQDDLSVFRAVAPIRKVALLVQLGLLEALPPEMAIPVVEAVSALGMEPVMLAVADTAASVLDNLPEGVDAVYLTPTPQLSDGELKLLIDGLNERQIASFSTVGRSHVEAGALMGLGQDDYFVRLSRKLALHLQRTLLGEDPGSLPVSYPARETLTINLDTARTIRVSPPWTVLIDAELIEAEVSAEDQLSMEDAVYIALADNLAIRTRAEEVRAGKTDVGAAWANLLPELGVDLTGAMIDKDRAAASFGNAPQYSVRGGLVLTQVLIHDKAWANVAVQKHLSRGLDAGFEALRLDVGRDAAHAYLSLLRARTLETLRQRNLKQTREHLEVARMRANIGTGGPGEVHRWEVELHLARKSLWEAYATRRQAEIAVNQLLHRPLDGPVPATEASLGDTSVAELMEVLRPHVGDPFRFSVFTDFMVALGRRQSPELRGFDEGLVARDKLVKMEKRSYFAPTVGLSASVEQLLYKAGEGTSGVSQLGPFEADPIVIPELIPGTGETEIQPDPIGPFEVGSEVDNTIWQVGVGASHPLFQGGKRKVAVDKASAELAQLRSERDQTAEKLAQWTRSALQAANGSYWGMQEAGEAAVAAQNARVLMAGAYSAGAVTSVELIDAAHAALQAELGAVDARFSFMLDFIEAQRSVGHLYFLDGAPEQLVFVQALAVYFEERGVPIELPQGPSR
jgi:outer membrane protein